MVSDEVQAKAWIPRLSGVQSLTALDLHGTLVDAVPEVRLTKEISGLVDSLAQGDFIGLLLIAVAATRIVMSAIDDATRHAVIVRLPRSEEAGELALCTDIDLAAPVTDFLRALHDELESAADVAWLDRSMVIDRLEAIGLPAARCLSQVAVQYTESGFDYGIPAQVRLTLRRVDRVFAVGVTGDGDSLPAGALALARCVAAAIAAIAVRPGQLASEVDVLGPDQRSELQSWAGMPCPGEFSPATLVDVVDHAAARGCDLDAVAARGVRLTHGELQEQSIRGARVLAEHGVMPGDRVAVLMGRAPILVVSILSVLRAGASFVPMEPSHPPARLNRQLQLSGARFVICGDAVADVDWDVPTVSAAALSSGQVGAGEPVSPDPDDEAAMLFTSGSTGLQRPVSVTHRQLAHKVVTSGRLAGMDTETRCTVLAAVSFDALRR